MLVCDCAMLLGEFFKKPKLYTNQLDGGGIMM